jgi:hypothetical protein
MSRLIRTQITPLQSPGRDDLAAPGLAAQLTAEEASAALVAMLAGHPLQSIEEVREVAGRIRARQRRSADALIADVKALGLQIVQIIVGDESAAAGLNLTDAKAQGRKLARRWSDLCEEIWARPVRTPQDAIPLAYVALFHSQMIEPSRLQSDKPFAKLVLAVLDLECVATKSDTESLPAPPCRRRMRAA